jgi:alpha-L-fucosidase
MPNGEIQQEFVDTLKAIGKWMQKNGESVYGTRGNVMPPQEWGVVTSKNNKLYVHVFRPGSHGYIFLPDLKQKVTSASPFGNNATVKFKQQPEGLFIYLDGVQTDNIDTIIELTTS